MFEKATRLKLRFETKKGQLSTEDLWDLPLSSTTGAVNLDDIARALHLKVSTQTDVSFVNPAAKSPAAEREQLALDVVKQVIAVRLAEKRSRRRRPGAGRAEKENLGDLGQKDTESLKNKTPKLRALPPRCKPGHLNMG